MLLGAKHTQAKFTPILSTAAASFLPRNTQHHQVRHKVPAKGTHLEKVQIYFPNGRGLCITYSWSIKGINRWYWTEQNRKTAPIATCSTKEPTKRLFFFFLSLRFLYESTINHPDCKKLSLPQDPVSWGWNGRLTAFPITSGLNNRGLQHPRETRWWDGRLGKGNKRLIVFRTSELCRWLLYSRWDFNLGFYWKKKCISQPEWPKPSGVLVAFFFLHAALDTLFFFLGNHGFHYR